MFCEVDGCRVEVGELFYLGMLILATVMLRKESIIVYMMHSMVCTSVVDMVSPFTIIWTPHHYNHSPPP